MLADTAGFDCVAEVVSLVAGATLRGESAHFHRCRSVQAPRIDVDGDREE